MRSPLEFLNLPKEKIEVLEDLRAMVREFVNREIRPISREMEKREEIPRDLIRKMAEQGFFGILLPEEYGGAGLGELGNVVLQEEITRGDASVAVLLGASTGLCGGAINIGGNKEQKEKYLTKIATGEYIGCFALTEPNAGSDAQHIETTAVKKGDRWILNGSKLYVSNGNIADIAVVFAANDRSLGAYGGITAFIVETSWKGWKVMKTEKKMGIKASGTAYVVLEDLEVPEENVLGKVGEGFKIAMETLDIGRITLGAGCLGGAKEAFEVAWKFANERKQFGQPIKNFQIIQHYLARMAIDIFTLESLVYRTAWMADNGYDVIREASIVKVFASEVLDRVVDLALQIHGGAGYIEDYPVEKMYRDARINRIFEGTNEIQEYVIFKTLERRGGL
jgi:alkylation response protein AidB-like acyl-CoA dehydrogenase